MSFAVADRLHNNPPPDLLVGDALREKLADANQDLLDRADALLEAAVRVPQITDDDVAGKVSDFIKQLTALAKTVEARRTDAKEPYLEGGRNIDGFFKAISEPILKTKTGVERSLTTYLREKEERARRERMEQERIAREAAEKARKDAEEKARAAADDVALNDAIEAERSAESAQADLVKAEQAANVKAAELSRTRGEYGSVSSLRTHWVFDDIDKATLDLETLRPFIAAEDLGKAVRAYIKAGGRELRGTRIYETTVANVR